MFCAWGWLLHVLEVFGYFWKLILEFPGEIVNVHIFSNFWYLEKGLEMFQKQEFGYFHFNIENLSKTVWPGRLLSILQQDPIYLLIMESQHKGLSRWTQNYLEIDQVLYLLPSQSKWQISHLKSSVSSLNYCTDDINKEVKLKFYK